MSADARRPVVPTAAQLDRRAQLLGERDRGRAGQAELDQLTDVLGQVMRGKDLRVRRLLSTEPRTVLDRLVADEPVHPFTGPSDLSDRLDADRRCFVLEHPAVAGRPFNIVWCALWNGICREISRILDPSAATLDPCSADTAVFYSIWNVEPGLVGLPGGTRLITAAVDALKQELPNLTAFVTLSPIPGFRSWHEDRHGPAPARENATLLAEAARYLTSLSEDGRPVDPVARFHLGNGARLLAINADSDLSDRGITRSYGLMANYRYEPEDREANRRLLRSGTVAVGETVTSLLTRSVGI